jgi:hypothetical protein
MLIKKLFVYLMVLFLICDFIVVVGREGEGEVGFKSWREVAG